MGYINVVGVVAVIDVAAVGKRITEKRKENGLTQERLAQEIGITGRHLYDIEKGRRVMSIIIFHGLKEVFGVSANWLLEGKE